MLLFDPAEVAQFGAEGIVLGTQNVADLIEELHGDRLSCGLCTWFYPAWDGRNPTVAQSL
jgi:hypothetical protein